MREKSKSPHILSTSSNLLGFTLLILASINGLGIAKYGLTDEATSICVVMFASSSLLSFMSMKSKSLHKSELFETIADYIFLIGLIICLIISILLLAGVFKLHA